MIYTCHCAILVTCNLFTVTFVKVIKYSSYLLLSILCFNEMIAMLMVNNNCNQYSKNVVYLMVQANT